jgi:pSer/pThr/pTyr-binding forkhead associated (FHA) protein
MGHVLGVLVARATGDRFELVKTTSRVGRRDSCDIVLPYANVSGRHCLLWIEKGYWMVEDLNSTNGTRVNGVRVTEEILLPGDVLSIARHEFDVKYSPEELGADGPPPVRSGSTLSEIPLMEKVQAMARKPLEEPPEPDE